MHTVILALEEAAGHSDPGFAPYLIGGIGAIAFIAFGLVTWSYRDVANRHTSTSADDHSAGHH